MRLRRRRSEGGRLKRPDRRQWLTLFGYAAAAAVYITIGVLATDFLLSVFVACAFLLLAVWVVPTIVRRIV
jgi:hypothetical protein